jgi:hypothetical protein
MTIDTLVEADAEPSIWVDASHVGTFSLRLALKGFAVFGSKA